MAKPSVCLSFRLSATNIRWWRCAKTVIARNTKLSRNLPVGNMATDGTGTRVQGRCRPFPESSGVDCPLAGIAAKGQTDQGGTAFSDLAIFGFAVTAIMAVGHIIKGVSQHRRISPTCSGGWFLTVLGAFQRGGSKPEVVVRGGSRCD